MFCTAQWVCWGVGGGGEGAWERDKWWLPKGGVQQGALEAQAAEYGAHAVRGAQTSRRDSPANPWGAPSRGDGEVWTVGGGEKRTTRNFAAEPGQMARTTESLSTDLPPAGFVLGELGVGEAGFTFEC